MNGMKAIMVGSDTCPKCRQAKKVLAERGLWAEIDYVDADSARGRELADAHGQENLPFYVLDGRAYAYTGEIMRILEAGRG